MRALVTVVIAGALGGCGGRGASGPAWPKSAGTEIDPDEEDGGESLAPRESKGSLASVESSKSEPSSASKTENKPEAKSADAPAEAKPESSGTTPPAPPTAKPDEQNLEEIVIEITD